MRYIIALLFACLLTIPAFAIQPGEALSDAAEEARARALMAELRCLVCQAESVEASPSPYAAEVRRIVREQIASGESDTEIKSFLVARYGEEILYRPSMRPGTWILWLGPFLLLGIGGAVTLVVLRGAQENDGHDALTAEEKAKLETALKKADDPGA